ncbi:GNAT family N-acetyltransferase [Cytobacillus firmus]|jgi:predicted GNAT superfamily acetyltransferase|uniref:GNAT family N-acetyltransferase n=1 Tax=Cytobacillus firmus TaxID=1399 RepID=A0AA46P2T7_CYTFI|nr:MULTISPECIES: GNAT family N-acetyltransferase [Bacillaceae]MCS0653229.1 GNAT family N-acetyltransferase [Cytobacillus firmus]MCU1806193.1 GNAT family N-acetyltransferase [Cytobacillus firmus]USK36948.1 GNAT family N-acetyltransferase [Cytobacillus firmus]UYG95531.1 GNAT family N-acetyltransferase [Cytobacillus firmus]WHY32124.1 GNAT family N-acetyltransferase [Cytobacillus firmus]
MAAVTIDLRVLKTASDMNLIQKLEEIIWNMAPLPVHQTITAAQNGGVLLGAFIEEELVGFSYGFPGFSKGKGYLCSHMLGIHPDHQDKGLGALLKQKQKELAAEMGYDLITWTFDPLESRNAYLNLNKLNAVCSTYVENCYGDMDDNLNHGLPTDRLKVEWWITSSHAGDPLRIETASAKNPFDWGISEDNFPVLLNTEWDASGGPVLVPIPANFQAIKNQNFELSMDWRFKTRGIFQTLFSQGYAMAGFQKSAKGPVHYYVLIQRNQLKLN